MTIREIRDAGQHKIADAALNNWTSETETDLKLGFDWYDSKQRYAFWSYVYDGNFEEALKICPEYRVNKTAEYFGFFVSMALLFAIVWLSLRQQVIDNPPEDMIRYYRVESEFTND